MNLKQKFEFYKQNKHELLRAVILCIIILGFIFTSVVLWVKYKDQFTSSINSAKDLVTPRYWGIEKVTPDTSGNTLTLNLKSNVGNLRTYTNVISYGLSQSGQLLAIHQTDGVFIINLEDESKKNVGIPESKFAGDFGNVIDWNKDDQYFAFPVLIQSPDHTVVWVYKNDGSLYTTIQADIPTTETGKAILEPVYFSQSSDLLLLRVYKKDDLTFVQTTSTDYSIYSLPIYLDIYNLQAQKVEEFNVRDYDTTGSNILYLWKGDTSFIEYDIYSGQVPDVTRSYLFTVVAIHE